MFRPSILILPVVFFSNPDILLRLISMPVRIAIHFHFPSKRTIQIRKISRRENHPHSPPNNADLQSILAGLRAGHRKRIYRVARRQHHGVNALSLSHGRQIYLFRRGLSWIRPIAKETLVGLGRFELPTNGLGNRCSIHLSYSPTLSHCNTFCAVRGHAVRCNISKFLGHRPLAFAELRLLTAANRELLLQFAAS